MSRAKELDYKELTSLGVYTVHKEPLIVYKKVKCFKTRKVYVLKCQIPKGREFVFAGHLPFMFEKEKDILSRKYRCNGLRVLGYKPVGQVLRKGTKWKTDKKEFISYHARQRRGEKAVVYKVGKLVKPHRFDTSSRDLCRAGIHFFMTKEKAARY